MVTEHDVVDDTPLPSGNGTDRRRLDSIALWAVVVAVLVGAVILVIAAFEEPYHIDELRQVRSYASPLSEVVDASFGQEQPPLDPVLNAVAQRFIGVGDMRQRGLSMLFGIGSLATFGALALRARFRLGAAAAVLVLALSPLLVSVTAYARPYALPLFLILMLLLATDIWLTERRLWAVPVLAAAALLLPLSRTVEPNLALGASIVVLVLWRFARHPTWKGSVWVPVGAATFVMVVVGVPVLLRLGDELAEFTIPGLVRWAGLSRWLDDIPRALDEVFALWPLFAMVAVVAVALPWSRRLLVRTWWFWVLAFVPFAFATVFVLRTPENQSFFVRYTFTWWPPFAVLVGATVGAVLDPDTRLRRTWRVVAGGLVIALLVVFGVEIRADLSANNRPDFGALGKAIGGETTGDTTVLFDSVRPLGAYRTPFAGSGRYLFSGRDVPLSIGIMSQPDVVPDSGPIAVALVFPPDVDIPGWQRIETGPQDSLYLPADDLTGRDGARTALVEFADVLGPDRGAAFALAAASLAADDGDLERACFILNELQSQADDSLLRRIEAQLARVGDGAAWSEECAEEALVSP